MMTRVPAGIGAPVPAGSFERLCPGPHAVSQGVPPFNDRAAPPVSEPGLPKASPPLAPVVLRLGRRRQIRGHGVGDLVVHFGTVGLEINGSDERVVRQVGVEQGAVVVVGAPTWWCLRPVRGRCLQHDRCRLRAGVRSCCAGCRVHAAEGDADHYQRRKRPRHHRIRSVHDRFSLHGLTLLLGRGPNGSGRGPEDGSGRGRMPTGLPEDRVEGPVEIAQPRLGPVQRGDRERRRRSQNGERGQAGGALADPGREEAAEPPVAVGARARWHQPPARRRARHDAVGHAAVGGHAHRATGAYAGVHELAARRRSRGRWPP